MSSRARKETSGKQASDSEPSVPSARPVPVNTGPILASDDVLEYNEVVLVGAPACDWLTLTTFSQVEYMHMQSYTVGVDTSKGFPVKTRKRMQYEGHQGDGWFLGRGRQEGRDHYMLQASGARAQDALYYALQMHENREDVKCTRIDLQETSTVGHASDLPIVGAVLRESPASDWSGRGPRPKVTWYSSEDERDTLYIGARTSPRFWRFYNKPVDGELYLRAELEAKGWLSVQLWDALQDVGMFHVKHLLGAELNALPLIMRQTVADCGIGLVEGERTPRIVEDRDHIATTERWFMNVVQPALERFLLNPEAGAVRAMLGRTLGFDG